MIAPGERGAGLAEALRTEFDGAFALPASPPGERLDHLLAVRIGGDPYAVAVAEITGLHVDRLIVPVPSRVSAFLGLAGIRGEIVPVYGLDVMLGYRNPARTARWLALCKSGPFMLGLTFDEFERHLNLSLPQIAQGDSTHTEAEHIRAVAHADDGSRPVVSIASVAAEIARRCATVNVSKEA